MKGIAKNQVTSEPFLNLLLQKFYLRKKFKSYI